MKNRVSSFVKNCFGGLLAISLMIAAQHSRAQATENVPDLNKLSQSAYIMGPGNTQYGVHSSWKNTVKIMKDVDGMDSVIEAVESVLCGSDTNKSVLIIGELNQAYRYLFARLANHTNPECPNNMWHAELNVSKVEAGHMYVGQVDEYWNDEVLAPIDGKNAVLYLSGLDSLIGIGSHSNDQTGIEREYVANFTGGRYRTVAFVDKSEYNNLIRTRNAYVVEAFQQKIVLPTVEVPLVNQIVKSYLKNLYPNYILSDDLAKQLYRFASYYQPNRGEPDRTLAILAKMIRNSSQTSGEKIEITLNPAVETAHPYANSANQSWVIENSQVNSLSLIFDSFETETYDQVKITDAAGNVLDTFHGDLGSFTTRAYNKNKLIVKFTSDSTANLDGFKISKVIGMKLPPAVTFTLSDLRRAIMEVAQVPEWMMTRDYTIIKNLKANLDSDVVGVEEGKRDLVRVAKIGYISGRTDEKPIGTVLLTGPTGTGKSYVAKKFADFMQMKLVTLDMTSYKDPSNFQTFVEIMSQHLANSPYAVFLFEEIDKASVEVLDQLYFMMDEGIFYDASQRPLFARGAFIMMTTNAGEDIILRERDNPELPKLVNVELQKKFRASFLNRFDAISIFKAFTASEFMQLARVMTSKKIKKMKEMFNFEVSLQDSVLQYIATFGASERFGARPMERVVENVIGTGVAEYQLQVGIIPEGAKLAISKSQSPEHTFKIAMNGGSALTYTIDPDSNGGSGPMSWKDSWRASMPKLDRLFQDIRDFDDN